MRRLFKKNGHIVILEHNEYEPLEEVIERGYFVVSQKPLTKVDYELANIYSKIYVNHVYKNCHYNSEVMKKLEEMMSNCKGDT